MAEDKVDYLEVDEPIPGQNYVCLSFVSPEALMQEKEAFKVCKFLQSYCKDKKLNFKTVYEEYKDFTYKFSDNLQKDFDEQNQFQTNVRGLKVRGVYETKDAAERRAKKLQTIDADFHVFVGQVGYWLPWDPLADKIESEEYLEEELNTLMKEYKQNEVNKDIFYEEQKREKIKEDMIKRQKAEKEKQAQVTEALDEPDPWLQSKFNTDESADAGDAANTDAANTDAANADTANADAAAANADANLTEEKVKVV